jgi:hypothetical protein
MFWLPLCIDCYVCAGKAFGREREPEYEVVLNVNPPYFPYALDVTSGLGQWLAKRCGPPISLNGRHLVVVRLPADAVVDM